MNHDILIGTCGWGYDEWVGPFYPKGLKKRDFLLYYSEIFYTNEINTTFYNIPSKKVVNNWVVNTPKNFLFSIKIPKIITHENKLNINLSQNPLRYFLKTMEPLLSANKLLSFLIQLPPSFTKERHFNNLKEFIENWPDNHGKDKYFLVVEFRHKSWMDDESFEYLRENNLIYCAVIEPLLPPRMEVTNDEFFYIRFHGFGKDPWFDYFFKEEEIKKWAKSIKKVVDKVERVGIYFNNHFSGYAAKNSLMLMKELNLEPRNRPEDVKILNVKKKASKSWKGQVDLDKFLKAD
jgi:uncharacterized protein YecE (DUF72 family)